MYKDFDLLEHVQPFEIDFRHVMFEADVFLISSPNHFSMQVFVKSFLHLPMFSGFILRWEDVSGPRGPCYQPKLLQSCVAFLLQPGATKSTKNKAQTSTSETPGLELAVREIGLGSASTDAQLAPCKQPRVKKGRLRCSDSNGCLLCCSIVVHKKAIYTTLHLGIL